MDTAERLDTQRDVEVPVGIGPEITVTAHPVVDLEAPAQSLITKRSQDAVRTYLGDMTEARAFVLAPTPLKVLVRDLWQRPQVPANNGLLKLVWRIYAVPAIPLALLLYVLAAGLQHPGRAVVVYGLLGALVWMWLS